MPRSAMKLHNNGSKLTAIRPEKAPAIENMPLPRFVSVHGPIRSLESPTQKVQVETPDYTSDTRWRGKTDLESAPFLISDEIQLTKTLGTNPASAAPRRRRRAINVAEFLMPACAIHRPPQANIMNEIQYLTPMRRPMTVDKG